MSFKRKLMYSGITAAAVGAVAVGITLQNLSVYESDGGYAARGLPVDRRADLELAPKPAASVAGQMAEVDRLAPKEQRGQTGRTLALEETIVTANKRSESAQSKPLRAVSKGELASVASMELAAGAASTPAPAADMAFAAEGRALLKQKADADVMPQPYYQDVGRDEFREFEQNRVMLVSEAPVSTFSVDVDTASYSFVRRMLNSGVLPQGDAVRAEEVINYFDYDYPLPESKARPFRATVAVSDAPWAEGRKLMHIGIKGFDIEPEEQPRSNLVFLLDVSGSMNSPDKLPLVKQSMELLLTSLNPEDTVAIAVYAGAAGKVLEPTPVKEK